MPQTAAVRSPVDVFRDLLAMTPAQQEGYLASRPPAVRTRIQAKIAEYQALPADERELRLKATELRWYLLPLMHVAPADRPAALAQVPADMRTLVGSRLAEWDILPPPLQQEFLDNERALRYFTHLDSTNAPLPGDFAHSLPDSAVSSWNSLSAEQHQRLADQFNHFFELPLTEKQRTLGVLSDSERQEMEKTLQTFSQLPPAQRRECLRAFTRFASMNPAQKQEFLKNAEHWAQMSPKDRQTWRDLVAHVPPLPPLPPMPDTIMPPMPPMPSAEDAPLVHPAVATNHN